MGFTEILVIGVVIVVVIGATRFLPTRSPEPAEVSKRGLTPTEARDEEILRARRSRGKVFGVVLLFTGIAIILAAPNLIRAFFMSYIWGTLIIVVGLASLYFMSRRS